jgi:hypothetical protein
MRRPASAHEQVINCLTRNIARRRIALAQTVSVYEDDAADQPSIVNPHNPMLQRLDSANLRLRRQQQISNG